MKFLAVLALAVACAHADVSHIVGTADQAAEIVRSAVDVQPESFNYNYETSNGISANAEGVVQNVNSEYPTQVVRGSYQYTGPDGKVYLVNYVADENGFHPEGDHLPVAPAIPEAIQRSLEYLRVNAAPEVVRTAAPVASAVPVVTAPVRTVAAPVRAAASATAAFAAQRNTKPFGRF